MTELLTAAQIAEVRNVSEVEREQQRGEAVFARTLMEATYRDLAMRYADKPDEARWREAKRIAKMRLGYAHTQQVTNAMQQVKLRGYPVHGGAVDTHSEVA